MLIVPSSSIWQLNCKSWKTRTSDNPSCFHLTLLSIHYQPAMFCSVWTICDALIMIPRKKLTFLKLKRSYWKKKILIFFSEVFTCCLSLNSNSRWFLPSWFMKGSQWWRALIFKPYSKSSTLLNFIKLHYRSSVKIGWGRFSTKRERTSLKRRHWVLLRCSSSTPSRPTLSTLRSWILSRTSLTWNSLFKMSSHPSRTWSPNLSSTLSPIQSLSTPQ